MTIEKKVARVAKTVSNVATIGSVAYKAFKIAKTVAALVNVERKYYDVNTLVLNTDFDATGQIYLLSGMVAGSAYNERNGNSIKATSIQYRINVNVGSTNTGYRIILYKDMEPRQALPAITDVLEVVNSCSPLNHINGTRFKIIKDIQGFVDTTTNVMRQYKFYKKLHQHIKFTGASAGITNTDEGHLYMLFLADSATGASSPTALLNTRLRYIDN